MSATHLACPTGSAYRNTYSRASYVHRPAGADLGAQQACIFPCPEPTRSCVVDGSVPCFPVVPQLVLTCVNPGGIRGASRPA